MKKSETHWKIGRREPWKMALSVQTSLSHICETGPPGTKSQGIGFVRFEHGYHLVHFNCVHWFHCHLSNKMCEIIFQLTIAPNRLWRSVWSVNHTIFSNGWPDHCTKFKYPKNKELGNGGRPLRGDHGASGCEAGVGLWEEVGFRVSHLNCGRQLNCVLLLPCVHHV